MLALARKKAPELTFEWGNALELPYADDEFAAVTVGFGARNFADIDRGLAEMTRVVRPGGRVLILEMTTPQKPPLSTFFGLWFNRVVPLLGKLSSDPDAYDYLPNSVKRWPDPAGLAAAMDRAGLEQIRWVLTAGGIIATHVGVKPAAPIITSRNGNHPEP
jgi:demethylmenaquinone methyltransferase/2-methoxy-6-polyprenyl-1,4-benzoquinol methylase